MAAHKRIEEELMEEKKAEDDYEHFLQEEAQRLDHRGFQAKVGSFISGYWSTSNQLQHDWN